jgi:hypothetical protein
VKYRKLIVGAFAMVSVITITTDVFAREIVFGKGRETIPVAFGSETLFRFPLEVKTITEANRFDIHPANNQDVDYSVLAVKPRMSEGAADVTFILSDGTVIRTQLVVSNRSNLKKDSIYDFKPTEELPSSNPSIAEKHDPMVISELDLMRAMVRGDQVSGFGLSRTSQVISLGAPDVSALLVKVYSGRDVNGYVYQLKTSATHKRYKVDLKGLSIGVPNLAVLAQVDHPDLGGKTQEERETYLRIVARPGASSHKVILPMAIEQAKTSKEER